MSPLASRRAWARRRLAAQEGFTMIVAILVLMVVLLLSAAAYSAAIGDMRSGAYSQDQKQAYSAAQAGLDWYVSHLSKNPSYWTSCTTPPGIQNGPTPIEDAWNGSSARPWRTISPTGVGAGPQFVIDLIPVAPATACSTADPSGSMIDPTTGTFRVRVTGRANANAASPRRSIVATFRRRGFLDFIYYTDFEVRDPALWAADWTSTFYANNGLQSAVPEPTAWINANCAQHWSQGTIQRKTVRYTTTSTVKSNGSAGSNYGPLDVCKTGDIQFADADRIAGPFHTNDSILVCNTPEFGRNAQDNIEISAPATAEPFRAAGGCGANPTWTGTYRPGALPMDLPPDNSSLQGQVTPGYLFTGTTKITLGAPTTSQMTVTNTTMGLNGAVMTQPANGVIYVANGNCGVSYDPNDPYGAPAGCGDLYVHGTYSQSMTLTSEKDIIVDGAVTKTGDQLLGLISSNYVRVYHPISVDGSGNCTGNAPGYNMPNPLTIEAAILTVQHSFTVDNYDCETLGTLNVVGAIAQKFRGIVGRGSNGYIKNYQYDDRLKYRSPPNFLDPLQSGWRVVRQSEQVPAS